MSLALDIGRIVEQNAGPLGPASVVTVALEVGTDAGVEVSSLEFCLGVVLSQPPFRSPKALIEQHAGADFRVAYLEVDDGRPDD